jgi:hypothetical protein
MCSGAFWLAFVYLFVLVLVFFWVCVLCWGLAAVGASGRGILLALFVIFCFGGGGGLAALFG